MISTYRSECTSGYGPQELVNQGFIHCTVPGAVDGLSLPFHFGRPSDIGTHTHYELYNWAYFAGLLFVVHKNRENWTPRKFPTSFLFHTIAFFFLPCCSSPTSLVFFCLLFNFHSSFCLGELRRRELYLWSHQHKHRHTPRRNFVRHSITS